MNSIDFHNSCVANEEYYARRQAQLDAIYDRERRKYSSVFNNTPSNNSNSYDQSVYNRLSVIENRLDKIENRLAKVEDDLVNLNESNGLFVFAPKSNIKSAVSFQLTGQQFRELMRRIDK